MCLWTKHLLWNKTFILQLQFWKKNAFTLLTFYNVKLSIIKVDFSILQTF